MSQYGSLQNLLQGSMRGCEIKPEVGMGATEILWSDRNPYEVIAVKDSRHVTVRELGWKRTDNHGMSDWQEYEYHSNPDGRTKELFLTKEGRWVERIGRRYGNRFVLGYAERYYDYTF